jgi:hypothetical protein
MKNLLPTGRDILPPDWPDAQWGLTGLFAFDELFNDFRTYLLKRFECCPQITRLYANLPIIWNGEDIPQFQAGSPQVIPQIIGALNQHGVSVFFTFANHELAEADLAHTGGNQLLAALDNGSGLNGVVLAHEALAAHVKATHPSLKRVASVVKTVIDGKERNADYYRALCDEYAFVQLHPDDAFDEGLLEALDPAKIEVTVNDNFGVGSETRANYYTGVLHALKLGPKATPEQKQQFAQSMYRAAARPFETIAPDQRLCNLTRRELKSIYDMGYQMLRLKCEFPAAQMRYDMMRYLTEPEMINPAIFKLSAGKLSTATDKPTQAPVEPPADTGSGN